MPSDSSNSPQPDALAASGRALALAICLAITGCQSTAPRSPADSDVQTPAYGVAFGLPNAPIKAETPRSGAFSSPVAAPRVAIGVDRARE